MSAKEQLVQVVADVPERQAEYVLFMTHALLKMLNDAEEAADEAFCIALDDAFEENPDKGELIDFEVACKLLGVQL